MKYLERALVRMFLAIAVGACVSASLAARSAAFDCDKTPIDCGNGCYVSVTNCPDCTRSPTECTFYFDDPSCKFWCTAECTLCEYFQTELPTGAGATR